MPQRSYSYKSQQRDPCLCCATQGYVVCFECGEPGHPADWRHSDCSMHTLPSRFPIIRLATPPMLRHSLVTKCMPLSDYHIQRHLLVFVYSIITLNNIVSKP